MQIAQAYLQSNLCRLRRLDRGIPLQFIEIY